MDKKDEKDTIFGKYLDEGAAAWPEVSKGRTTKYLWNKVQKLFEDVLPDYSKAAGGIRKSRRRMTGKEEE